MTELQSLAFSPPPTRVRKYNTIPSCFYIEILSFPLKETCLRFVCFIWVLYLEGVRGLGITLVINVSFVRVI